MANQTIPIQLTPTTVPTDKQAANINELLAIVAQYIQGSIRADVSFFLQVLNTPSNYVTDLIYNSTQQVFKAWNANAGEYQTITQFIVGDVKTSFIGVDQVNVGWVVLNGRAITAVPGLTSTQIANLQTLFPSGSLPTITPLNGGNLPAAASFSDIPIPTVEPADGVIAALPFSGTYDELEVEALRDATEILRDSTAAVETQVAAIQDKCDELLTALRTNGTPTMYALTFCGYP